MKLADLGTGEKGSFVDHHAFASLSGAEWRHMRGLALFQRRRAKLDAKFWQECIGQAPPAFASFKVASLEEYKEALKKEAEYARHLLKQADPRFLLERRLKMQRVTPSSLLSTPPQPFFLSPAPISFLFSSSVPMPPSSTG